jgi:hypothetical protein
MKNINWKPVIGIASFITFFVILISTAVVFLTHTDNIQFRKTCVLTAVEQGVEKQKAIDYCVAYQTWIQEMDSKGWK